MPETFLLYRYVTLQMPKNNSFCGTYYIKNNIGKKITYPQILMNAFLKACIKNLLKKANDFLIKITLI